MGNDRHAWDYDTTATYPDADLRPSNDCMRPENTTERVAIVLHQLHQHGALTNAELSSLTGLSSRYVGDVLRKASRVVPIYKDDNEWKMVDNE